MSRRRRQRTPDLAAYAGKWVAFSKNRIVASGASLPEVMRKVPRPTSRVKPTVFLVPRRDEGPYVLVIVRQAC